MATHKMNNTKWLNDVRDLYNAGTPVIEIAKLTNSSYVTVNRALYFLKLKLKRKRNGGYVAPVVNSKPQVNKNSLQGLIDRKKSIDVEIETLRQERDSLLQLIVNEVEKL